MSLAESQDGDGLSFCPPSGFGLEDGTLSPCLQQCILGIPLHVVFFGLGLYILRAVPKKSDVNIPWTRFHLIKVCVCVLLTLLPIVSIAIRAGESQLYGVYILAFIIQSCSWAYCVFVMRRQYHSGQTLSRLLRGWWLAGLVIESILLVLQMRSHRSGGLLAVAILSELLFAALGISAFFPHDLPEDVEWDMLRYSTLAASDASLNDGRKKTDTSDKGRVRGNSLWNEWITVTRQRDESLLPLPQPGPSSAPASFVVVSEQLQRQRSVSIPNVDMSRPFAVYLIKVSRYAGDYTVGRRFKAFRELERMLKTKFGFHYGDFPNRKWGHSKDADFVESRRAGLETFLQTVLSVPELQCEEVEAFLSPQTNDREKDAESIHRRVRKDSEALDENEDQTVRVTVPSWRETVDPFGSAFVEFEIEIVVPGRDEPVAVFKRYSDFHSFHTKMHQSFQDLPDLPGRHIMKSNDSEFLETRRFGLESYLTKLVATPRFCGELLCEFLELPSDTFSVKPFFSQSAPYRNQIGNISMQAVST